MQAAYGDAPRRVSGLSALGMAGVPVVCRPEVCVEDGVAIDTSGFGFRSWSEGAGTLLAQASRITDHTWVSTPARAVLECAQYPYRSHRWEEHIARMITNRFDVCSPDEVAAVADELGWRAGLRRLSSLAEGLITCAAGWEIGFDVDPDWARLCQTAGRGDQWIHLAPLYRTHNPPGDAHRDVARRVRWQATPEAVARQAST